MDDWPPYDPRSVANHILNLAWDYGIEVTHLSLQKILYFLHEQHLREFTSPLCKGYFIAWKHGPVHPEIWNSFKAVGRNTIRHHAYALDINSGMPVKAPEIENKDVRLFIAMSGLPLLKIPAHRLVGLSHLRNGPWDKVTRGSGGQREYGARISDELMLSARTSRMLPINESQEGQEDLYEQPPP